jgi:hypothetical protein
MLVTCNMNLIMPILCEMQWKFGDFLPNSSKFKLTEFKMDEKREREITQLKFKLVEFKYGNTINYTLKT